MPWGGGGYFRLVPYALWLRGVVAIQKSGKPYIFYIHPWEIDRGHPVPAGMGAINRFRQTVGLAGSEARFAAIASEFEWDTVGEILGGWIAQQTTHEAPRLTAGMN